MEKQTEGKRAGRIYLKSFNAPPMNPPDVVRVTPEAGRIIRALQRETGLTAQSIVSQIIIQAEALIVQTVEE